MSWDTSCPDWKERLLSGRSLVPDLPLFEEEAAKALRVFKRLRMSDVIGTPTCGEAAGEWLFHIVAAIFGSYNPDTNERMISEFFLEVPKKNGKTVTAALVMLTAQILNRRPEAESSLIAPAKDVADRQFQRAAGAIRLDPELDKLFQVQNHIKTIQNRKTGAKMIVRAADEDIVTGSQSTFTVIDETHVLGAKNGAPSIFLEIRGALTSRPDGFLLQITTQSKEQPTGQFREELAIARKVRDGQLKLPLLPVLYELPPELAKNDGWRNRKYWPLVNPNWGRSVNPQFLENELTKADVSGAPALALFASQHFNVEIGTGLSLDGWAGADFWQESTDETLTLDRLLARCDVVVVGIDGGGLDDLLGLAVLGREKHTRRWLLWCKAWCQSIVLTRRKELAPLLLDLQAAGELEIIDLKGTDVSQLVDIIQKIDDTGLLPEKGAIGVDVVGIHEIIDELERRELITEGDARVEGITQGYKLQNAIKTAERRLSFGEMVHADQRLMQFCVGNAKVEQRGNAILITKQVSGTGKIDPLMAAFNAIDLMSKNPESSRGHMDSFLKSPVLGIGIS